MVNKQYAINEYNKHKTARIKDELKPKTWSIIFALAAGFFAAAFTLAHVLERISQ